MIPACNCFGESKKEKKDLEQSHMNTITPILYHSHIVARYQRGSRSLADNLQLSKEAVQQRQAVSSTGPQQPGEDDEDEEYDIPDDIENVIGEQGLS